MFFRPSQGSERNNALRYLDQNWRLTTRSDDRKEMILFGRVVRQEGPAEEIANGSASPTQLWLGALPATAAPRPPLNGSLNQETYVRVIIPIR
jgi:hypothetical protein